MASDQRKRGSVLRAPRTTATRSASPAGDKTGEQRSAGCPCEIPPDTEPGDLPKGSRPETVPLIPSPVRFGSPRARLGTWCEGRRARVPTRCPASRELSALGARVMLPGSCPVVNASTLRACLISASLQRHLPTSSAKLLNRRNASNNARHQNPTRKSSTRPGGAEVPSGRSFSATRGPRGQRTSLP